MNLDRVAFHEDRLERLNAHSVKGGCTVEHHGVLINHRSETVEDRLRFLIDRHFADVAFGTLDHSLRRLDRINVGEVFQFADDERFVEFQSDLLGKSALVQVEVRSDDDDRSA